MPRGRLLKAKNVLVSGAVDFLHTPWKIIAGSLNTQSLFSSLDCNIHTGIHSTIIIYIFLKNSNLFFCCKAFQFRDCALSTVALVIRAKHDSFFWLTRVTGYTLNNMKTIWQSSGRINKNEGYVFYILNIVNSKIKGLHPVNRKPSGKS